MMQEVVCEIINETGNGEDKVIEVLIELQNRSELNYLSKDDIKDVSKALDIPETKIYGIAQFYSMLSTIKRGKHVIQVCDSPPCHIRDSDNVIKVLEDILGIKMGQGTADNMFFLEYSSCLGACDMSPAIRVDDKIYGNMDRGKIFSLLAAIRKGEAI
jgi:NADH-quinone oxidoreductase subunit E